MIVQNLPYLFATYAIVFIVLLAYLAVVAAQVRGVRRDLEAIRIRVEQPGVEQRWTE